MLLWFWHKNIILINTTYFPSNWREKNNTSVLLGQLRKFLHPLISSEGGQMGQLALQGWLWSCASSCFFGGASWWACANSLRSTKIWQQFPHEAMQAASHQSLKALNSSTVGSPNCCGTPAGVACSNASLQESLLQWLSKWASGCLSLQEYLLK